MLSGIFLENFKTFKGPVLVPIAPITLIYGENSAGKSSITQSLSLLKQTRESREIGATLLPRADSGLVDLGSFQELVFDHETKRNVAIGLRIRPRPLELPQVRGRSRPNLFQEVMLRFEFGFSNKEIELLKLDLFLDRVESPFASFTPEPPEPSGWYISPYAFRRGVAAPSAGAKLAFLSQAKEHWESSFRYLHTNRSAILKALKIKKDQLEKSGARRVRWLDYTRPKSAQTDNKYWSNKIQQFISTIPSLESVESWASFAKTQLGEAPGSIFLDGFLPVGVSYAPLWIEGFLGTSDDIDPPPFLESSATIPEPTSLMVMAASLVERRLEQTFPLGPFRRAPERYYIYTGSNPSDVGYRGDLMPDLLFRNSKLLKNANRWLDRLEIGYKLNVRPLGKSNDLFELRLSDKRRDKAIDSSLSDVGFGLSQLLPFLVQSLAKSDQIITVEQPEVHIHPRLQADLGDLIADSASSDLRNQFIIETHSEHLMLRIQRLVRVGRLRKQDVCVLFVARGPDGAQIKELRLDDDGEFLDPWPGGFFPERLRELL
jgi:hypothetical protein